MFATFFSLCTLLVGTFFSYVYFQNQYPLVLSDASYAQNISSQLLEYFLTASITASILFSLLVYAILSTQETARRIAYKISKDIALSKEQFRRFYELSPVPYLLIDSSGVITRPNKASLRFFKRTEETLLGENIFSFLRIPDQNEKIAQYKERIARRIPIERKEIQIDVGDGHLRWILLSIEDITAPGFGQHNGLVTLVDIHEQKELERIKTEFLSLASHQLRSPLSNIKWYIEFLLNRRRDQISEEVVGYLQKMYQRNADMVDLVNTLLNLSRIEMGRIKIQKDPTDLTALTQSVVEELSPQAKQKRLSLQTEFSGETTLDTDSRLVRIILQNLLSNALRYTKEDGKVLVRILASTTKVRLEVEDTGVGIPPNEQDKIFSKLYRATNAKELEANGNGIGLYMCKEMVESLGGTISFSSVYGTGTTFFVDLPR